MMKTYASVQDFLKECTPEQREAYARIKKIVLKVVPDATEVISYGIPTFDYAGKHMVHIGNYPEHMSFYPGGTISEEMRKRLKDFRLGKGTIQFTPDKPVPADIVEESVRQRYEEILARTAN